MVVIYLSGVEPRRFDNFLKPMNTSFILLFAFKYTLIQIIILEYLFQFGMYFFSILDILSCRRIMVEGLMTL